MICMNWLALYPVRFANSAAMAVARVPSMIVTLSASRALELSRYCTASAAFMWRCSR